jgi:hypothetical protein
LSIARAETVSSPQAGRIRVTPPLPLPLPLTLSLTTLPLTALACRWKSERRLQWIWLPRFLWPLPGLSAIALAGPLRPLALTLPSRLALVT